ncbi:MAG: mechanosensitive ion channel [Armatimonadetes bacterium]|nr:mechanosensitive ion channel [Armatimonadota bacterium]MDW8122110.1 mechanosensitive ion channel [Armatimonadota bacterium]
MPAILEEWVRGLSGWTLYWLVPRLFRSALILVAVRLLQQLAEGLWRRWLAPFLPGRADRPAHQAVFRRQILVAVPISVTRWFLLFVGLWLIAEQFTVPREVLALVTGIGAIGLFIAAREKMQDWFAGYALAVDDCLLPGDAIEYQSISGTVDHWGTFGLFVRTNDQECVFIPFRFFKSEVRMKRQRAREPSGSEGRQTRFLDR